MATKTKVEERLSSNNNYWLDATSFIKTIINENIEELIHKHLVERGYNNNEKQFFRAYLTQAFDMYPMKSCLKNYDVDEKSK